MERSKRMKILLVHNHYGSGAPSGENQVVAVEKELLERRGHSVESYFRFSDQIRSEGHLGAVGGGLVTPWNPFTVSRIREVLERVQPEVVHVHNTFPLISPSVFSGVGVRAARVLTLHNYRLFCPAALPIRNGNVCIECLAKRSVWPAVRYGCYRDSRAATLPLAVSVALHRWLGTWQREVDAFIALSDFQRDLMVDAGLPRDKVHVKPNFYPGDPSVVPWASRDDCIVYVGRLSPEKGLRTLAKVWQLWGAKAPELRIVGEGELLNELRQKFAGNNVRFYGQLSASASQREIARAKLLVLPSEWFETFGLVVLEAFAHGTPAAVSNLGALPTLVDAGKSGVVFSAGNAQEIFEKIRAVWESPGMLERLGQGASNTFQHRYREGANYEALIEIYMSARNQSASVKNV